MNTIELIDHLLSCLTMTSDVYWKANKRFYLSINELMLMHKLIPITEIFMDKCKKKTPNVLMIAESFFLWFL